MGDRQRVLFLCTGNSARSQMGEALLRYLAGDRYDVFSAGTAPKGLHPRTVEIMKQIGIDVSQQTSKDVQEFQSEKFDFVITVCDRAKQKCPIFPGAESIHWSFEDPAEVDPEQQEETFRKVRDEILQRLRVFVVSHR